MMTFIDRLRHWWANLHSFPQFLIVAAAAGLIGLFALKPAYRVFKAWRLERNLSDAGKALRDVRMDEARDLSLTVLQAGDPRIDAYRILEQSMASLRDPRHADVARALLSHPQGSDADRLAAFRGMAPEVALGLLGQAWVALPENCRLSPEFAAVFADRLMAERHFNEAAVVLLGVPEKNRTSASDQRLIRVLIGSGKREGFEEAQRRLAKLWPADAAGLEEWLEIFEAIPVSSLRPDLLGPLRASLEHPAGGGPARHALALARLDYAADFNRRADLLDRTIRRWKDESPVELARFLGDLGLQGSLLETYPVERLADYPELFPRLLAALEHTGDWAAAAALLESREESMPKIEWLARRARAAAKAGDPAARAELWKAAMSEAGADTAGNAFLTLRRIAMEGGMQAEAEQALVEAIFRGRGPLPLYAEIQPQLASLASQGRENLLPRICAMYLLFEPGNPVLLTQYAYIACLNDLAEPSTILKALEPMAKAFPKEVPAQMTLAAVYLCAGQPSKAAETLDRFDLKPEQLPPPFRVTWLATRLLNHRMSKDDPLIRNFPWKSLMASERRKFSALIESAASK